MEYHVFAASARPVSDEVWEALIEMDYFPLEGRASCIEFGEGYLLEIRFDGFYPHAWWYSPVRKATLQEAVETLWEWRKEWVSPPPDAFTA